jgi:anti-sigma-K factor RskA
MTEHEYWDELAAAYALHGLTADEELVFVEHLASCDECLANVKDHELVAAQLGSISHYRESDDEAPTWESMRSSIMGDRATDGQVVDLAARRRRYDVSRRALAAAAAVVLVAGGGIATWRLTAGGSSCTSSSNCHTIQLDAAGGKREASVVIRDASVTVKPTAMPLAPVGKVYVLWQLSRNHHPAAISVFNGGSSSTVTTGALKASYADTSAFAVSEENAEGAPPQNPSNNLAEGVAS